MAENIDFDINTGSFLDLESIYKEKFRPLTTNLHRINILSNQRPHESNDCNLLTKEVPVFHLQHNVHATAELMSCYHYFLGSKFNYTPSRYWEKPEPDYLFGAHTEVVVSNITLMKYNPRFGKTGWEPFGGSSRNMEFVAFQRQRPSDLSGTELAKPYDSEGSRALLTSAGAMCFVTIIFMRQHKLWIGNIIIVVSSIISGTLDQPLCSKLDISCKRYLYNSEVLGGVWITWVLMLVVLVNGYKGFLLYFLTMGKKPVWPLTLKELVSDNSYCIISGEYMGAVDYDGRILANSYVLEEYILPLATADDNDSSKIEHIMLRNKLRYISEAWSGIVTPMIKQEATLPAGMRERGYKIQEDTCEKFALIETRPGYDSVSLLYFMESTIMSESVVLPNFHRPSLLVISKNFFTETFIKGVSALEATGILNGLERFVSKWFTCTKVLKRKQILQQMLYEGGSNREYRRCLAQVTGYIRNPNKFLEESPPQALTFRQLHATFRICAVCVASASFLFVLEFYSVIWSFICKYLRTFDLFCCYLTRYWTRKRN